MPIKIYGKCHFLECERGATNKGMMLCPAHYAQSRKGKGLRPIARDVNGSSGLCKFPECGWPAKSKGFCNAHNQQVSRGKPLSSIKRRSTPGATRASYESRIKTRIERTCAYEECARQAISSGGFCQTHKKHYDAGKNLAPISTSKVENWHGTPGGYSNHKCRCDECRASWNSSVSDRRRKRVESGYFANPILNHGTSSLYFQGCRCADCSDSGAAYARGYKEAKLAAKPMPEDGLCQCCGKKKKLNLDHNHETNEFRGWLCHGCNTAIGKLGDNIEGLMKAVEYLKRS